MPFLGPPCGGPIPWGRRQEAASQAGAAWTERGCHEETRAGLSARCAGLGGTAPLTCVPTGHEAEAVRGPAELSVPSAEGEVPAGSEHRLVPGGLPLPRLPSPVPLTCTHVACTYWSETTHNALSLSRQSPAWRSLLTSVGWHPGGPGSRWAARGAKERSSQEIVWKRNHVCDESHVVTGLPWGLHTVRYRRTRSRCRDLTPPPPGCHLHAPC